MNHGLLASLLMLLNCSGQTCCAPTLPLAGTHMVPRDGAELLPTTLEIHCATEDVIEVEGYRLQSQGQTRFVRWWLKPGTYTATVVCIRAGERHSEQVSFAAGTTCHVRFGQHVTGDGTTNYGVDPSKLSQGQSGEISGTLTRDDVQRYIAATSSKPRVTIVVPQSQVDAVRTGARSLDDLAIVQVYAPGHWALERAGIVVENNQPTVLVQDANGKLLAKTKYETIDQVRELVEKCSRGEPSQPLVSRIPWWGWLIIAYLVYRMLFNKKQRSLP